MHREMPMVLTVAVLRVRVDPTDVILPE